MNFVKPGRQLYYVGLFIRDFALGMSSTKGISPSRLFIFYLLVCILRRFQWLKLYSAALKSE